MFGRGGFYGGYGGYGGFDDDSLERGDWAEKSGAASRRVEEARAAFKAVHGKAMANPPAAPTTYELLKPSTHLTQPCWRDLKKHIACHAGWSAKRRQATEAEKRQSGEKRQSAVYFVDVTFTPPKGKGATSAGKKTVKVDKAAKEEARAQMSSSMSSWVAAGAKRPVETTGDLSEEEVDMAPKRKKVEEEEENDAPPSGQLKTKRWSVQLKRLKGSMGLGIDDQYYVTAVKEGGAAATEGSIAIGDHILEINGVETGTLSKPIPKILPTNPDAPVKVRLARYSAETSAEEGVEKPRAATKAAATQAAATKGAATKSAATKGFEIRYSRSSSVVEWDEGTFTDCRPSEAQDVMEETAAAAMGLDVANASMHQMAQGGLPRALVAKLPEGTFETAAEANEAALAVGQGVAASRHADRGTPAARLRRPCLCWSAGASHGSRLLGPTSRRGGWAGHGKLPGRWQSSKGGGPCCGGLRGAQPVTWQGSVRGSGAW